MFIETSATTTPHCRRDGFPRSYRRTPAGNRTTARGGFPGFRVVAIVLLPKAEASVDSWTLAIRLQLRGQPRFQSAFQFKSHAGTLRVGGMIRFIALRSKQVRRVMAHVIGHEGLDEVVAMIVALLHAQIQLLAGLRGGGGEFFRHQFG